MPFRQWIRCWQNKPPVQNMVFAKDTITIWEDMRNQFGAAWRRESRSLCYGQSSDLEPKVWILARSKTLLLQWSLCEKHLTQLLEAQMNVANTVAPLLSTICQHLCNHHPEWFLLSIEWMQAARAKRQTSEWIPPTSGRKHCSPNFYVSSTSPPTAT